MADKFDDDGFGNPPGAVVPTSRRLKEINVKANRIKTLPRKKGAKEINQDQGAFDFQIDCQTEAQGIGMGVLKDGTPFLNQRGLARLCGVENAHIGTISSQWKDDPAKPRISKIKELLATRGFYTESAHVEATDGITKQFAYPDAVCLAILEYYAFEAGANYKEDARKNFRLLAGKALQDFIYAQVGYDPNQNPLEKWQHFHDRVSLTYDSVPIGYFGIFKELSDMIVHLGQSGLHIDSSFLPDISIGISWGKHWVNSNFDALHGSRIKWEHNYPDYFPQSLSNPQPAWCYPDSALGEFRRWTRETYIGEGKFAKYLNKKVKEKQLPPSFAQLAIASYSGEE